MRGIKRLSTKGREDERVVPRPQPGKDDACVSTDEGFGLPKICEGLCLFASMAYGF